MKTSPENLTARLNEMSVDELREFAANIVRILYLVHDDENPEPVLDSENEWDGETLERVAEEVSDAGLCPPYVALADQRRSDARVVAALDKIAKAEGRT